MARLEASGGKVSVKVDDRVSPASLSQEIWGLRTETYEPVSMVMLSPNHWEGAGATGNKHTFFVLRAAKCDEPARGIYNEFLHSRLAAYGKVFELIGEKTKCPPAAEQLSGLGFSSTRRASFVARAVLAGRRRLFDVKV